MLYNISVVTTIDNKMPPCGCGGMADALDLGSSVARRGGSSPFNRTTLCVAQNNRQFLMDCLLFIFAQVVVFFKFVW